ncbi:T9SS type A sorting domain-containing protein [Aquimarina agarivorans]|uniref:T9SS type A sorting domain-containing protein n=1 Tax=Aquimarina agarivorans TaxID=980584 RepID=UPI000248EBF9|nr:T9SS type A sorting domain-containing protein [Aquimarina agarivorans]
MKKILLILTTFISVNIFAQELSFTEERNINLNKDYNYTIVDHTKSGFTIDNENNKIIVGGFDGLNVDFGNSNLISAEEQFTAYIAKYNQNNNLLWLKSIGGSTYKDPSHPLSTIYYSTIDFATDVKVDSEDNIYVLATIDVATTETVDLDPEHPHTNSIISTNNSPGTFIRENQNIFLIKYSKNGEYLWHNEIQDDFNDIALKLDIDVNDNVIFTGYINGFSSNFIDFDPSKTHSDDKDLIQSELFTVGFVVQYDNNGNFITVNGIGNGITSDITVNALPSGDTYASGSFNATISPTNTGYSLFKNSPNPTYIGSLGHYELGPENQDIFVTKYNNTGQVLWVNTISSSSENRVVEIVTDENENVFVSGYINGNSVDFDRNSISSSDYLSATVGGSAFVAKYNSTDGSLNWVKLIEGGNFSKVRDITIQNDKLIIGGEFNGDINIGSSKLSTNVTNPFIAIIDTDGNWEGAGKIEKTIFASISDVTIANDGTINYFGFEAEYINSINTLNMQKMFLGKVDNFIVSPTLSLDEPGLKAGFFSISPNPASNYLNIEFREVKSEIDLKIYNSFGQIIFSQQYSNTKKETILINSFSKGIYILTTEENGILSMVKIIKK